MYYQGQGVVQRYEGALVWYRKAVYQGNAEAHFGLGELELIKPHMTQKPMLRAEVDARALRV